MKIVACYKTFNEADIIGTSINSVIDLVDFVVVVDGAYVEVEDDHDCSWDGTREIVVQLVGKKGVVIQPTRRFSEPQARNQYLRFVQKCMNRSWVFVIDSDEVLCNARDDFEWLRSREGSAYNIGQIFRNDREPDRMYGFDCYTSIHQRTPFHPRFYHGIPELHYAENHWTLRDAFGDRVEPKYARVSLPHAWLDHRRTSRNLRTARIWNHYNIYSRWKYERVERPLKSYLPYKLLVNTETVLDRIRLQPQRYLKQLYWYTLGSITRKS